MDLAAYISPIGTIIVITFLAWKEYRSGTKMISSEVITNYEALDKQQKSIIAEQEKKFNEEMHRIELSFTEKIAHLEGVVREKDTQLKTLTEILTNRNPELQNILIEVRDFMKTLVDSTIFQNEVLSSVKRRDKEIDEHTEKGTGKPIRR